MSTMHELTRSCVPADETGQRCVPSASCHMPRRATVAMRIGWSQAASGCRRPGPKPSRVNPGPAGRPGFRSRCWSLQSAVAGSQFAATTSTVRRQGSWSGRSIPPNEGTKCSSLGRRGSGRARVARHRSSAALWWAERPIPVTPHAACWGGVGARAGQRIRETATRAPSNCNRLLGSVCGTDRL